MVCALPSGVDVPADLGAWRADVSHLYLSNNCSEAGGVLVLRQGLL